MDILEKGTFTLPRLLFNRDSKDLAYLYTLLVFYCSWKDGYHGDWDRGQCVKSISRLVENSPFTEGKIRRLLDKMEELGLITRKPEGGQTGTRFTIIDYEKLHGKATNKQRTNDQTNNELTNKQTTSRTTTEQKTCVESDQTNNELTNKQTTNKQRTSAQHQNKELITNNLLTTNINTSRQNAEKLQALWNDTLGSDGFQSVIKLTLKRITDCNNRLKEIPEEYNWKLIMLFIKASPQYNGQGGITWRADFDWLLKPGKAWGIYEKIESGIEAKPQQKRQSNRIQATTKNAFKSEKM